ncbi:MAG: zinc ABC transporter substrate-binding protein, partial [Dehalococcoidia bacterium]|nr:zinc ABC transporter substrate-binding protein [Dehalococcoidia bacterium]
MGALPLLLAGLATACGGGAGEEEGATTIRVVTTVSPIRNIIENVGGDRVTVTAIVPEGTNSHTFEPSPSVAREIAQADLIVANGLNLELPTLELAEANRRDGVEIVLLGEATVSPDEYVYDFSFPEEGGDPNPHLWTDPILAGEYAVHVRDALGRLDPEGAAYYAANTEAFVERLEALDAAIK